MLYVRYLMRYFSNYFTLHRSGLTDMSFELLGSRLVQIITLLHYYITLPTLKVCLLYTIHLIILISI